MTNIEREYATVPRQYAESGEGYQTMYLACRRYKVSGFNIVRRDAWKELLMAVEGLLEAGFITVVETRMARNARNRRPVRVLQIAATAKGLARFEAQEGEGC